MLQSRPRLSFFFAAAMRRYILMIGMNLLPLSSMRVLLLRLCGAQIGEGCYIGFNVFVDTNYPELVSIGDKVTISHNCSIITHTISPVSSPLATLYKQVKPVLIHSGSWIGMNSVVLPGSVIGRHCFIGAGSVVASSMPTEYLCAGNPCKPIKKLSV